MPDEIPTAEELKTAALQFLIALNTPTLTEREVAWEGIKATMLLSRTNDGDIAAMRSAVARLSRMANPA